VLDDVDPCPTVAGEANGGCGTFEVQGLQFGQANAKVKRGDFLKAIKAGPRGSRLRMATGCEYKPDMPGSPRPSLRVKCKGGAALSFSPATARALGLSKAKALIDRVTVDPKKVEYGEGHDDGWPVIFVFKPKLSKALLGKLAKLKVIELVMTSYVTDPQGKRVDRKPAKTTFKG
jgi:hypothetical protein